MKIEEIIQRIQSLYSKGVQSDDSRLSSRHIYSVVLNVRATLITNKINKKQSLSQWVYQDLNCVELIKALPYECPCLPSIGCEILRTKHPLPKPLTGLLNGHLLQSVTSLEGSINFDPTTWKDKKFKSGNKYTKDKPDYYIKDNYLFITSNKNIKAITITGVFEDPLEAEDFPGICGKEINNDCLSPLDKEFRIEKDMIKTLIEMSSQELLGMFSQGTEDTKNDSTEITQDNRGR